ncbi:MAG: mechanosensitive ion channel [Lentisphaerae bacterium]|nr:mechanosensitive ion channel [Lentisphaerota bacterium]
MNTALLHQFIYSAVAILCVHLCFRLLKHYAKQTQQRLGIRKSRYFAIKRALSVASLCVTFIVLILIWNLNLKSVWVSATGILALIAISFFAIWSLIGNILAGFILYFTSPFRLDDRIHIIPDGVKGTVLAVNTFYTVLLDEERNYINVPNSMFFQKYIQVIKTAEREKNAAIAGSEH